MIFAIIKKIAFVSLILFIGQMPMERRTVGEWYLGQLKLGGKWFSQQVGASLSADGLRRELSRLTAGKLSEPTRGALGLSGGEAQHEEIPASDREAMKSLLK